MSRRNRHKQATLQRAAVPLHIESMFPPLQPKLVDWETLNAMFRDGKAVLTVEVGKKETT